MKRAAAIAAALVALGAVSPPVHALAGRLFSVHMVQHLVLMVVAAPVAAFARPVGARLHPLAIAGANAVVVWAWHAPRVYEAALGNPVLHVLQHGSFAFVSWVLWSYVLHGPARGARVGVLFATALQSSALGAILAFASVVLYDAHGSGPAAYGLTPLEDQQLAGSIMWIPAGIVYLVAMVGLLLGWFRALDREAVTGR